MIKRIVVALVKGAAGMMLGLFLLWCSLVVLAEFLPPLGRGFLFGG